MCVVGVPATLSWPTMVGLVSQCRGSMPSLERPPLLAPGVADAKLESSFWKSAAGSW